MNSEPQIVIPKIWLQTRLVLSVMFVGVWLFFAISPPSRADWMLENALTVLFALVFVATWQRFCFSPLTYVLIFIFLCMHTLGSHYTYEKVPYDQWWQAWTGFSLNEALGFERNHYDRLVHFCYGLLLAYPVREAIVRWAGLRGFWGYFIPLDLTMSTSMIYELIEWGAAEVFGGELAHAYLGSQGDVWDAHRDMALASLGALMSMTIAWLLRDRMREWWARL